MNARSALFDVYGDHLRTRGGQAPVAALVAMMRPLDVTPPAVRTAISRMVTQGWLTPVRTAGGAAGYAATERAERRLHEAAGRIYRTSGRQWDGRWHLLTVERVVERTRRERVRNALGYLGYGQLRDDTWISPHRSDEVAALLAAEGVTARSFVADHEGDDAALAAATWDLDRLAASYDAWLAAAREIVPASSADVADEAAFVTRSRLVHEWRKFLFRDPGLPAELLPSRWPGDRAADFFDEQAGRLMPGAGRYVDSCLSDPITANGES